MTVTPKQFVIAGAGIGGLTAAIALAQIGHEVVVLEQAPALAAIGAGVTLAPNAMRAYAHLGLVDEIVALGVEPRRQRVQHWRDGRVLVALERGDSMRETYGAPYVYIHRGDLQSVLARALDATGRGQLRLGAEAAGAEITPSGAAVRLAGGELVQGDVVIGADGLKSPIRRGFEPGTAHFTGHVAWRSVITVQGEALAALSDYPGMHIGPGQMMVRYPVRQGRELNLVFFARQAGWTEEGWAIPAKIADLRVLFGDWAPDVGVMLDAIDEARLFKWAIFARSALPGWVQGGRIALLGDAAHAMTPFLGQGAGCAIEDAIILARCFGLETDTPNALARYEAARRERCGFIQGESNANADRMQGTETELYGMTKLRNEETLGLFSYDAGNVEI